MATPQRQQKGASSLSDVLERARKARGGGGGGSASGGSNDGVDWDSINSRLAQRVEFVSNWKALETTLGGNGQSQNGHSDSFSETAQGLASLISALKSDQSEGRDSSDTLLKLFEYLQQKDESTLREEIRQMKDAMSSGGTDPTLGVIQALADLGVLSPQKGDSTLDTLKTLRELGLVENPQEKEAPKSMQDHIREAVELVNMLRPQEKQQPQSVIQMGDGTMSIQDYLAIEQFRDQREQRAEERKLQAERMQLGREALDRFATALADASAYLLREEDGGGAPAKASQRANPGADKNVAADVQWTEVACDHCGAENYLDLSKRPETFFCTSCGERNTMEYLVDANDQPAAGEEASGADRENHSGSRVRPILT